ncbi:5-formyltetrahydrofolate cyclo-ligase [Albimonas sp. CAU 1670]|uniref:5-formyltetrahydrofolate cyclo-ligase n=1 Tax=Albimonas sp. CAU 1670 TaxID=3032599 RepID=UPI0023DBFDAF|nr:5-formyltetrahydrofolate cyclo-ligase [Albimonas sp. CAU 1670]MDF2233403.1 5-formyltetrahydrofolate cyclo-ligase [Albimonas sp. CAU 1670]
MDIAQAKTEARRAAFARRREARLALGPAPQAATDAALAALLVRPAEEVVAGYVPIRTEIDPRPLMAALHAAGRRLCVPVIEAAERPLRFREWTPGAEMVEGPFGAAVPAAGDWLTPAALIVPLVAFDARLRRLGYGGGFYDRTLAGLQAPGGPGAYALGFAYAAQEAGALPAEPTDRPLDALVTETGLRS